MRFLLDTPVISELIRPKPNASVVAWVREANPSALFVSVITFGELAKGIAKLENEKRKRQLLHWVENDLTGWFEGRVLEVDLEVAERWGLLLAKAESQGQPIPAVDALLAATALTHGLVLVTRNVRHFEPTGVEIINPWQA